MRHRRSPNTRSCPVGLHVCCLELCWLENGCLELPCLPPTSAGFEPSPSCGSRKLYYLDAKHGNSVPLRKSMVGAFSSEAGTTDGLCRVMCDWGKGIVGQVAMEGHPIITNNAASHPSYDAETDSGLGDDGSEMPCTSLLATPVRARDGSVGAVLELLDKNVGTFGPVDAKLLRQVATEPPPEPPLSLAILAISSHSAPDSLAKAADDP